MTLSNIISIDRGTVFKDSSRFTSQKWKRMMFRRDGMATDTVRTTQKHRELWKEDKKTWRNYHNGELGGKMYNNGEPYYA